MEAYVFIRILLLGFSIFQGDDATNVALTSNGASCRSFSNTANCQRAFDGVDRSSSNAYRWTLYGNPNGTNVLVTFSKSFKLSTASITQLYYNTEKNFKDLLLEFEDGSSQKIQNLTTGLNGFHKETFILDPSVDTQTVNVTVISVYATAAGTFSGFNEIEFDGTDSSSTTTSTTTQSTTPITPSVTSTTQSTTSATPSATITTLSTTSTTQSTTSATLSATTTTPSTTSTTQSTTSATPSATTTTPSTTSTTQSTTSTTPSATTTTPSTTTTQSTTTLTTTTTVSISPHNDNCIIDSATGSNICFIYEAGPASWDSAKIACETNHGGNLVNIIDANTNGKVEQIYSNNKVSNGWTAGTVKPQPFNWQWIADDSVVFSQGCVKVYLSAYAINVTNTIPHLTDNPTVRNLTVLSCVAKCAASAYPYALIQDNKYCFCDITFGLNGNPDTNNCDFICIDNGNDKCGGINLMSAYLVDGVYERWGYVRPYYYGDGLSSCGLLKRNLELKFADSDCHIEKQYICEIFPFGDCSNSSDALGVEVAYNSHCYYVGLTGNTWFDSQMKCVEKGGYLVKIADETMWEDLRYILEYTVQLMNLPEFYIGLYDRPWLWAEANNIGRPWYDYFNWAPQHPKQSLPCLIMSNSSGAYHWQEEDCYTELPYICETGRSEVTTQFPPSTTPSRTTRTTTPSPTPRTTTPSPTTPSPTTPSPTTPSTITTSTTPHSTSTISSSTTTTSTPTGNTQPTSTPLTTTTPPSPSTPTSSQSSTTTTSNASSTTTTTSSTTTTANTPGSTSASTLSSVITSNNAITTTTSSSDVHSSSTLTSTPSISTTTTTVNPRPSTTTPTTTSSSTSAATTTTTTSSASISVSNSVSPSSTAVNNNNTPASTSSVSNHSTPSTVSTVTSAVSSTAPTSTRAAVTITSNPTKPTSTIITTTSATLQTPAIGAQTGGSDGISTVEICLIVVIIVIIIAIILLVIAFFVWKSKNRLNRLGVYDGRPIAAVPYSGKIYLKDSKTKNGSSSETGSTVALVPPNNSRAKYGEDNSGLYKVTFGSDGSI